jgi:hypothetical protein
MDVCKDYGGSALIEDNVIWDNEGWCFVANWSDNSVVRNNTCWMNGNGRADTGEIIIGDDNHAIYNNITVPRPGRLGLAMKYGTGNTFVHNLVQGGNWLYTWPENLQYLNADPRLADPAAGDFHIMPDSPAIDSGDNANAATVDADGNHRPRDGSGLGQAVVDIGAYEYVPDAAGVYGDINGDGVVDAADVLLAERTVLNLYTLSSSQFQRADVAPRVAGMPAPDGKFNVADVLVIVQLAQGR